MSGNIGPRKLVCAHIPLLAAMSDGGHGRPVCILSISLFLPDDLFVKTTSFSPSCSRARLASLAG